MFRRRQQLEAKRMIMKRNKNTWSFVRRNSIFCGSFFFLLLLLAIVGGCVPPSGTDRVFTQRMADPQKDPLHTARLSCFLNLKDDRGPAIRLEVSGIEVVSDVSTLQLIREPLKIDSTEIGAGQLFLGGMALPPGNYRQLRLTVTKGEVKNTAGIYEDLISEPLSVAVNFNPGLSLESEDSSSLLITWDVKNSLLSDNVLDPVLTASPSLRQMLLNLVFVTCPEIDTVFVVRTDKNWVVDSFGLKGRPTYIAINPSDRNILYVLCSRDRMVKAVDLSSFRVINFFQVPLNDEPTYMTISPDGKIAFLLDERNGYLSRVNLTTGSIEARVLLGDRPIYAAYLQEQNLLAVSLSLSQKVLLLNPASLGVIRSISTGNGPQGLIVIDNQLFLAESRDNAISVTDLTTRGTQNRLMVGFDPRRLLGSESKQIFVSNYQDGSISILYADQVGVIREIYGLGRPLEMALNAFYHRLYVTDEMMAALAVIDTESNRLVDYIALGARPFDLDVIQ